MDEVGVEQLRDDYVELLKRSLLGRTVGPTTLLKMVEGQTGAQPVQFDLSDNIDGKISVWGLPPWAMTMIGLRRMENLETCVRRVIEDGVPGDLIETGVWRGGATIFMRGKPRGGTPAGSFRRSRPIRARPFRRPSAPRRNRRPCARSKNRRGQAGPAG